MLLQAKEINGTKCNIGLVIDLFISITNRYWESARVSRKESKRARVSQSEPESQWKSEPERARVSQSEPEPQNSDLRYFLSQKCPLHAASRNNENFAHAAVYPALDLCIQDAHIIFMDLYQKGIAPWTLNSVFDHVFYEKVTSE